MRFKGWLAPLAAGLAFLAVCLAFFLQLFAFRADIERWARRDLADQAGLAAETLREPLATQDFRRLTAFARELEAREMILRVRSARGGWIFRGDSSDRLIEETVEMDAYRIGVAVRASRVLAPFYNSLAVFLLAALVGVLGMAVVFFALYRQRVRIRELARLERFRRTFIADFSHELKTPLTGILSAVDLLEGDTDGSPSGADRRALLLGLVRKESRRLNALATSLLDLAKLERGEETATVSSFDAADLLRELAESQDADVRAGGLTLNVTCREGVSLRTDRDRLFRALSNLVANAVRHSLGTRIDVRCEPVRREVRFVVEDDGVGIPAEERTRIFERFHRLDASRTTPGTGLGLAIVRQIARLLGGDVVCEAREPKGTRFVLTVRMR